MDSLVLPRLPATAPDRRVQAPRGQRRVLRVAVLLVVAELAVRSWLVVGRNYYADDLDLLHLADRSPLLSSSYLLHDYAGHLMPGAFLLVGAVERAAPLGWWPAAVSLIVLQALASLALLRLLWVLLGNRPALLVPLAVGLFSPLTLGFDAWWAAAVNSLPLQIGAAWFLSEAVQLTRTGRRRHALGGTAALAFALAFYLKAVLLLPLAVGVVAVVLLRDGVRRPLVAALRRGRPLWAGALVVLATWGVTYLRTRESAVLSDGSAGDVVLTVTTGLKALAPVVLGGPFHWEIRPPGTPIAALSTPLVVGGAVVLLCACIGTTVLLRGAGAVWVLVVGTAAAGLLMAGLGRSGAGLGAVAPLAYRYFAIESVLLPVALALLASLPPRRESPAAVVRPRAGFPRWAVPLTALLTASFVAGSLVSTVGYARAWEADRTGDYLATARGSLEAAGPAPLLEQPLPPDVMSNWSHPHNLTSYALAPLPDRPRFAPATSTLQLLDDAGQLVPARVLPATRTLPGPVPGCGHLVQAGRPATLPFEAPVPTGGWTVQLGVVASRDGILAVALDGGAPVEAPVPAGGSALFVRLTGAAAALRVDTPTDGLDVCLIGGLVGFPVP